MAAITTPDVLDHLSAAEFVARFEDAWRTPDMHKHEALWRDDIVLIQPLMGTLRGKAECRLGFERLFRQIPDLHAVVHGWSWSADAVFIEFTLRGSFGGSELSWSAVDRFTLAGGRIAERVSYFDAAALVVAMATARAAGGGCSPRGSCRASSAMCIPSRPPEPRSCARRRRVPPTAPKP